MVKTCYVMSMLLGGTAESGYQ